MNSSDIEKIVRQVLQSMGEGASAPKAAAGVPATSRVAMLTQKEHFDIQE